MLLGKPDPPLEEGSSRGKTGGLSHSPPAQRWTHEPRVGGRSPQGPPSNCSPFGPFQTKSTEFYKQEVSSGGGGREGPGLVDPQPGPHLMGLTS